MKRDRVIVWFRQDLRLHDNEALTDAIRAGQEVLPVYIFDERLFKSETPYGFKKTGVHRARFIIESIRDLRNSLQQLGTDLYVRVGIPEDILFDLARQIKTSWIFCNRERTQEEKEVQDALESHLWSIGQEMIYSRGKMLYYTQDLPFPITHCPDTFTTFRKEVERFVPVRDPISAPKTPISQVSLELDMGEIPSLEDLGYEQPKRDERAVDAFKGGETAGLNRLKYYLWETDLVKSYKETRNGLIGGDYSTKFAPWLSQGCLSPKMIYRELKAYEAERGANDSTYWVFFELLWRDFFRLMAKKHGNHIFMINGTKQSSDHHDWSNDEQLLTLWIEGRTGVPFIDANMREIAATGFMSNRGRQNVASFLVKDLKVNWKMGASYFESLLIDYDPASNWGNWNYVAGVGSDPREGRYFNILSQAKRYDPNGDYVRLWLPELSEVQGEKIHNPMDLTQEEQLASHIRIGDQYPRPMVSMDRWS